MDLFTCSLAYLGHFPCLWSGSKEEKVHNKCDIFKCI